MGSLLGPRRVLLKIRPSLFSWMGVGLQLMSHNQGLIVSEVVKSTWTLPMPRTGNVGEGNVSDCYFQHVSKDIFMICCCCQCPFDGCVHFCISGIFYWLGCWSCKPQELKLNPID